MELRIIEPVKAKDFFDAKLAFTTGPAELQAWMKNEEEISIIDVRAANDFVQGHIPGAVSLPKDQWNVPSALTASLNRKKINIIYCYSHVCHLAAAGALEFATQGFPVMEMEGGMKAWRQHGFKVEEDSLVTETAAKRPSPSTEASH